MATPTVIANSELGWGSVDTNTSTIQEYTCPSGNNRLLVVWFAKIEKRFDSIENKLSYWGGAIAVLLGLLGIIQIVLKYIL